MTLTSLRRKHVGIFPRSGFQSESRLLASLAQLYPVDFSPEGETDFDQMDAAPLILFTLIRSLVLGFQPSFVTRSKRRHG